MSEENDWLAAYPVLRQAENHALIGRAQAGDVGARELAILHNMRLVVSIARRMARRWPISSEDAEQEGVFGLMRAIKKFDLRSGYAFSTYATIWIVSFIQRAADEQQGIISRPTREHERLRQVRREASATNTEPPIDPLEVISLDAPTHGVPHGIDTPATLLSVFASDGPAPDACIDAEHKALVLEALLIRAQLTSRERLVLELRYGLTGGEMTVSEIARTLGRSTQRVQQLHAAALAKLRLVATRGRNRDALRALVA